MDVKAGSDLESLYREHGRRLWRAVFAFAGDQEVASDAVAEAFAQALRRGDALRDPLAWVWRAAFRLAAGDLKRRRRFEGGTVPGWEDEGSTTRPGQRESQPPREAGDLVRALARLSPKQRAAVILHHYAGFPVKEVARMIGSTSSAVKVHLSRGRSRLRELLEERDD